MYEWFIFCHTLKELMNAESIRVELIFAKLIFSDFVQIRKINAANFIQIQSSAKIRSEKFFKKLFFPQLNMQVKFAKPLILVNCWKI